MSTNKSEHLEQVLQSHRMSHVEKLMDKYLSKREEVKEALDKKYADKKASSAINSGSYAKHTAINTKFDIDLCQPYKYSAFATLEAMADDLYNFFMYEYQDPQLVKYKIRKQRVSVGLTFVIDGEEIKMDVVPGRELSEGDYSTTHDLNLYVRAKGTQPATYTQTNIQAHIDHIKGKNEERQIIRLLKIWKTSHDKDLKSFFIELITIRAFDDIGEAPSGLWEMLKMTMEFIRDKVETIRLTDPANSANIVSDTLTSAEKTALADDMRRMLQRIEADSDMIKAYFPVNDKYTGKGKSTSGATVLKTQSFG
jgi:hypothetical protein